MLATAVSSETKDSECVFLAFIRFNWQRRYQTACGSVPTPVFVPGNKLRSEPCRKRRTDRHAVCTKSIQKRSPINIQRHVPNWNRFIQVVGDAAGVWVLEEPSRLSPRDLPAMPSSRLSSTSRSPSANLSVFPLPNMAAILSPPAQSVAAYPMVSRTLKQRWRHPKKRRRRIGYELFHGGKQ